MVQSYIKILVVKNIRTDVMVGLATKSINITSLTHSFASLLGQLFLSGDTARLHAPVSLVGQGLSRTTGTGDVLTCGGGPGRGGSR